LNIKEITKITGRIKIKDYTKIIVHSELTSVNKRRADIAILLFRNNMPDKALIIEAKSAKVNASSDKIKNQISKYLRSGEFIELENFETKGCALTKNKLIIDHQDITAISWSSIFEMLGNKSELANDYLQYITNIKGTMKFYEKEVFSVPAGNSNRSQYNYPFIYECPNKGKTYTSMKKPLFMAFRKRLGIMEKLFGVDEIIIMNPKTDYNSFMNNNAYSDDIKKRVTDYCNDSWEENNYVDDEKQFFILSKTNQIELKHKPRPKRNNPFRGYYKLSELLNEEKVIVETD